MNGDRASLKVIADRLVESELDSEVEVVIAPPSSYLDSVKQIIRGKEQIGLAAQNTHEADKGAFTGEISNAMAVDCGANYVILGHSERRHVFNESNDQIGKKTKAALSSGLIVIACIGEKEQEREDGKTMEVCVRQLEAFKSNISDWNKVVIAYEPVWAIGTGKVATPEIAQETHHDIRKWIKDNIGENVADSVRILYGGSVNGKNCVNLSKQPDIDGFLVGGASLKPEFIDIINCNKE